MNRGVMICVDDESMILTSLAEQLRQLSRDGLSVELAQDGEEALDLLEELMEEGEEVPLFISDQLMPGMKGDEVLKRVSALSPHTRTILLTGQADLEAVQRAVNEANLYRYLSKPWERSDLLLTVRGALSSYRQELDIKRHQEELKSTNEVFRRFVPSPFLDRIAREGLSSIALGFAESVELTVLFSDIRGFTSRSESMRPADVLRFLNDYFSVVSEPIYEQGGFIDKFIGDGIMAIFDGPAHAQRAISASLKMLSCLEAWSASQEQPVRAGVGLHSGEVVMGTVGTERRMDSTILGDTVNLAARLEGATKQHGCALLISHETLTRAEQAGPLSALGCEARFVDKAPVKGRSTEVPFYALTPLTS